MPENPPILSKKTQWRARIMAIASALKYPWFLLKKVNQSLADWITAKINVSTSASKVLGGELSVLGFTLMQIAEYAGAIVCWVLLGFLGFATSLRWGKPKADEHPAQVIFRMLTAVGSLAFCVILITITSLKKPEYEPWTSLQELPFLGKYRFSPISVSPSSVKFENLANETYDFTIANNKDKDVYMIAIKFLMEHELPTTVYRLSAHDLVTPTLVWHCQDARHRPLFLLTINRIPAHQSVGLRMVREAALPGAMLTAKINYFTYSPQSFSALSSSSVGTFIRPEENLTGCRELGGASGIAEDHVGK